VLDSMFIGKKGRLRGRDAVNTDGAVRGWGVTPPRLAPRAERSDQPPENLAFAPFRDRSTQSKSRNVDTAFSAAGT
jgi:hypothetical protein